MRRNNLFAKFIITLTLVALLTIPVGRVTGVFALAAPVPELAPIFDTQIYQLQDYFEENIEGTPHEPIFYLILGCYLVLQAGMGDYQIVDPYTTSDGVTGWLKSTGIQLWNSLNSFVSFDPVTGTDLRPTMAPLIAYALGASELAYKYNSEQAFLDDVSNSDHFFLPFDQSLQMGINVVLAQNGGLYNWQFTEGDFHSDFVWNNESLSGTAATDYNNYLSNVPTPRVFFNAKYWNISNVLVGSIASIPKYDLFIDTDDHKILFHNATNISSLNLAAYDSLSNIALGYTSNSLILRFNEITYIPINFSNYTQLVNYYLNPQYNNDTPLISIYNSYFGHVYPKISDFLNNVYYGINWDERVELNNITDLNFNENSVPYYLQVQNDYLLDIKGLLSDLINITNLYPVITDNLYGIDGTLVVDLPTIQVSVDIVDTNPLPVNLNDIEQYTDNEYLDVVKERVNAFSDTIGSFVAFWHNTDYEIVYAVFGSALIVLLGAFIGKWGHS